MATSTISLSASSRNTLLSLQSTSSLISTTQNHLSTGLKVSSIIDDPINFFKAKSLTNKADDLNGFKDGIDQGISVVKGALNAVQSVQSLLSTIKGLAAQAQNETATNQATLQTQARNYIAQLDTLLKDSTINGVNLLYNNSSIGATSLAVTFSSQGNYTVNGQNLTSVALGITSASITFDTTNIATAIASIDAALSTVKTSGSTFGTDVALLQTRLDFSKNFVNTLQDASGKLTLADLNEESANLLALQTRQQLGVSALSFASQTERSILTLFN